MQRIDEHKGVFIDCVAVVSVADDKRINAVEFRNEQFENAEGMHSAQCIAGITPHQYRLKVAPKHWPFLEIGRKQRECFRDAFFRIPAEAATGTRNGAENLENNLRVVRSVAAATESIAVYRWVENGRASCRERV